MAEDRKDLIYKIFDEIINQRQLDKIDQYFHAEYVDHGLGVELHGRGPCRRSKPARTSRGPHGP